MELQNSNYLFYDSCRLCLEESGSCYIFEETYLPRDIFVCTGVKLSVTDHLPEKICKTCCDIIKQSIDFRELVAKNDLLLRSLLSTQNGQFNEYLTPKKISSEQIKSSNFVQEIKQENSQVINKLDKEKPNGSENTTCTSVPTKTISIRKDLFPSSVQNIPTKESNVCDSVGEKRIKVETSEVLEYRCANSPAKDSNVEAIAGEKRMKIQKTEVLEYRCGVCCKNYDTWKKLYLHARLHNKNILCPLDACDKKFATKGDLEKHIRTHTGEKPYQCSLCEKSFAQRVSLKSHRETVHNGEESGVIGT